MYTKKHKMVNPMTNKLKDKTQKDAKPKPTGKGSPVRTAHIKVHKIGYKCGTRYNTVN